MKDRYSINVKIGIFMMAIVWLSGCVYNADDAQKNPQPTPQKNTSVAAMAPLPASGVQLVSYDTKSGSGSTTTVETCNYPAGWQPYRMEEGETADIIAARRGVGVQELLQANCKADINAFPPGTWLYVPAQLNTSETVLPPGISVFDATPSEDGKKATLSWQSQGPIQNVRVGWLYGDKFIEVARNLPQTGILEVDIPQDGRNQITFAVQVSDGIREVAAHTTLNVSCPQGWFFAPQPLDCPTPLMTTTFYEQHFEHGTIVYIPAMGVHFMMPVGQPARQIQDMYVPGMPPSDITYTLPEGANPALRQPMGAIFYAWRNDEALRTTLGFAIEEEIKYTGMLQRTVSQSGITLYFSAASGHVYVVSDRQPWGVIIPQ